MARPHSRTGIGLDADARTDADTDIATDTDADTVTRAPRVGAVLAFLLTVAATLAGCGERPGDAEASGGDLTPRAIAAVMLDHLPGDTTRREAMHVDEDAPRGLVGADFRYGGDGEDDGHLVEVAVSPAHPTCPPDGEDPCVDLGKGTVLSWDLVSPEEDPGIVVVHHRRGKEVVTVVSAGPEITRDPRRMPDLEPSVDDLVDLARDPRLRLRADQEVLEAGADVEDWKGGEVEESGSE